MKLYKHLNINNFALLLSWSMNFAIDFEIRCNEHSNNYYNFNENVIQLGRKSIGKKYPYKKSLLRCIEKSSLAIKS